MSLSHAASTLNANVWHIAIDSMGNEKAYCWLCNDSLGRSICNVKTHENTHKHQAFVLTQPVTRPSLVTQALQTTQLIPHGSQPSHPAIPILSPFDIAGTNLLYFFLPAGQHPKPLPLPATTPDPIASYLNDYWMNAEQSGETSPQSPQQTEDQIPYHRTMKLMSDLMKRRIFNYKIQMYLSNLESGPIPMLGTSLILIMSGFPGQIGYHVF
ncbi:hypothetical protein IW262DRAFT_1454412 [Armillaria fumosa]|nr:hypothetical protein IW262DRAFT_1454412 [Armillaria fumosa]